jgi:hypothetical protein
MSASSDRILIVAAIGFVALSCGSRKLTSSGGGHGGAGGAVSAGEGGSIAAGGSAPGRGSGGAAGAGGMAGQSGVVECGSVLCDAGMICCNAACGICAPPGGGCVAGCPATGGSSGGGGGGAGVGAGGNGGGAGTSSGGSVGRAGAGGVAGSEGSAGSSGADGGQPVDAAVTCTDLHNQYAAAIVAASRCTVDAGGQCTQLVASSFPLVHCGLGCGLIYVNDASSLGPPFAEVLALNCTIAISCGAPCVPPTSGVCVPTDGGSGTCETAFSPP